MVHRVPVTDVEVALPDHLTRLLILYRLIGLPGSPTVEGPSFRLQWVSRLISGTLPVFYHVYLRVRALLMYALIVECVVRVDRLTCPTRRTRDGARRRRTSRRLRARRHVTRPVIVTSSRS